MKKTVIRIMEIVLGIVIFLLALFIFRKEVDLNFGWFLLIGAITAITIWVIDGDLSTDSKKIAGIIIGFGFSYPIAYVIQLFAAWLWVIFKGILFVLKIKLILYVLIIGGIATIAYFLTKKYD